MSEGDDDDVTKGLKGDAGKEDRKQDMKDGARETKKSQNCKKQKYLCCLKLQLLGGIFFYLHINFSLIVLLL